MRPTGGRHRSTTTRLADAFITAPAVWAGTGGAVVTLDRAARPGTAAAEGDSDGTAWTGRALRTLAGVFVVTWSFRLSGYLTFATWLAIPVALLGLMGLLAIVAAWLPDSVLGSRRQQQIDWGVLLAVLAALALWSYFQVFIAPDYGTDEIAFDQYAAQLALHGINPYLHSMAAAFPLFHVSPNGYTFRLDGSPVTTLSYPALSFEAYLPLLALGIKTQAAVWAEVAAWALGAVILFTVLPRKLAPLAAVVVSLDVYIGYAVGGITDFLFVPLLVGAAVRWDRFAATRGPAAWRGPILMGLAMAVKQTPWLVVPFVVAGIVLESRRARGRDQAVRDGLRYLGIAAAAFVVPNLPYLLSAPSAWLRGVLTPFSSQSVPAGQGLISLSLSLPVGGGSLRAYTIAAAVVFAAIFACYLATYPALKAAAFLLPSLALFFATRSFGSYLVMLIPAAIAAAATTQRPHASACWQRWRWVVLGGTGASALAVVAALTSASPLTMSIRSVRTTGQLATVQRLTLTVTNVTGRSVRPAFTVEDGMSMTAFWRRAHGPAVLGPHQRASYTIEAPSYFAMPSISNGFQVLAFSQRPGVGQPNRRLPGQLVAGGPPAGRHQPPRRQRTADHRARRDREPPRRADAGGQRARLPRPGDLRPARPAVQPGRHQPGPARPDARPGAHQRGRRGDLHDPLAGRHQRPRLLRGKPGEPEGLLPLRLLADPRREVPLMSAATAAAAYTDPRTQPVRVLRLQRIGYAVLGVQLLAFMVWSTHPVPPVLAHLRLRDVPPGLVPDRAREP